MKSARSVYRCSVELGVKKWCTQMYSLVVLNPSMELLMCTSHQMLTQPTGNGGGVIMQHALVDTCSMFVQQCCFLHHCGFLWGLLHQKHLYNNEYSDGY